MRGFLAFFPFTEGRSSVAELVYTTGFVYIDKLLSLIFFFLFFEDFFSFIINREEKMPPLIYQDSTSVISLVIKGGGIVRTKHLHVRMNLCKEAVEEKRIRIAYIHTTKMLADGLMKPLEGKAFQVFRRALLGLKKQE